MASRLTPLSQITHTGQYGYHLRPTDLLDYQVVVRRASESAGNLAVIRRLSPTCQKSQSIPNGRSPPKNPNSLQWKTRSPTEIP